MNDVRNNNNRIVKNTIALYIRMLVITLISFYTVRVTLRVLGADDFGIYNVVCGVIGFLGFITTTLNIAAQRFLSYDLGRNDENEYKKTFSMVFFILLVASVVVVVFAELIGPWLINNYLVIPSERLGAARWIFQISIVSFIVRFLVVPYSASIIAHERMGLFTYISIFESVAKLVIVFLLSISGIDKLIAYTLWLLLTDCLVTFVYIIACLKRIPGCKIVKYWNKNKLVDIGHFLGWNALGSLSSVFSTQGLSIIMNLFFSPQVIASKAVADKIQGFSYSFVANFIIATSPQLTKYYAIGDKDNLIMLFFRSTKICFFLMLVIAVPLIITTPELLSLWLSDTLLDEMIIFTRLTLIGTLFSAFETPISRAIQATGKVKSYQIVNCIVAFATLPIVYLCFYAGLPSYWAYIVSITILAVSIIYRIVILHNYVEFSYSEYSRVVLFPILLVVSISFFITVSLPMLVIGNGIIKEIVQLFSSGVISVVVIFCVGLNKTEKRYLKDTIKLKFKR